MHGSVFICNKISQVVGGFVASCEEKQTSSQGKRKRAYLGLGPLSWFDHSIKSKLLKPKILSLSLYGTISLLRFSLHILSLPFWVLLIPFQASIFSLFCLCTFPSHPSLLKSQNPLSLSLFRFRLKIWFLFCVNGFCWN